MYLGVDGGGTKTAYCLVADERVIARFRGESVHYLSHGLDSVEPALRRGIGEVCAAAGITVDEIDFAFFGIPGLGESQAAIPVLEAIPGRVLGHQRYACGNDVVCGWAGSLGAVDGVHVVAGTGSISYGQRLGRDARAGGWGELFGDEGSGYWVALQGLNAFSRMSDGRLAAGPLRQRFRAALQLDADLDAVQVLSWDRARVAALSVLVAESAEQGDPVAAQILQRAAAELAALADAIVHRLDWPSEEPVPISYSGGLFGSRLLWQQFDQALAASPIRYQLREPAYPPDEGAARYAARLAEESRHGHRAGS